MSGPFSIGENLSRGESLAEFVHSGANQMKCVFPGDMRVGENTSRPTSVGAARHGRQPLRAGGRIPSKKWLSPLL